MAQTDRSSRTVAETEFASPAQPPARRRMSTGHLVMIVAGLLATLLTYSVLREAGGRGTEVLVAARRIRAGETVTAATFTTASLKAAPSSLRQTVAAGQRQDLVGRVAAVDVEEGQIVARQDFR